MDKGGARPQHSQEHGEAGCCRESDHQAKGVSKTTKDKSQKKEKPTEEVEVPLDDSFEEADPKTLKPMKEAKV